MKRLRQAAQNSDPFDAMTGIHILRARREDAALLTDIAFAAKRHWRYPEEWIESWRDALTIQPGFITEHETWMRRVNRSTIGFYAIVRNDGKLHLAHLWVLPEGMGKGVGRSMFLHALERARELGFPEIEIESDPNAEGFYLRMGARRVGLRMRETDEVRRELPVLVYTIRPES